MDRNSFGRLFTATSCNRNSGIRLRVSDTKSRLETSKDRHFRLPEVQGKLQLLLEIIYYARRSSSRTTMLIKLAKQLLPVLKPVLKIMDAGYCLYVHIFVFFLVT